MANLKTTLANDKLGKTSTEELDKLAEKAGVPTPTSPTLAATLGATPDQAKMAGSSANLKKTLTTAAPEEGAAPTSLRDTLRHEQARRQLTTAEKMQQEMQTKMQQGGQQFTAERAAEGVQGAFSGLTPEAAALKLQEEYSWVGDNNDKAQQDALTKLLTTGAVDTNTLASINGPDGKPIVKWGQSSEELTNNIKAMFGDPAAQIEAASQEAVIDYDEFGIRDIYTGDQAEQEIAELAESLDMTPEDLDGMNMTQIQDAMNRVVQEEYSRTENLFEQATDENLSPAERAEARKMAKDMGATGIASMELSDVDELADQVLEADTIDIGEQTMTVEDVLSDDYISGVVANYLSGDPNAKKELESMGELKSFVDTNKSAFDKLTDSVDQSARDWADIQSTNKQEADQLASLFGSEDILQEAGLENLTGFSDEKKEVALLDHADAMNVVSGLDNKQLATQLALYDDATLNNIFANTTPVQQKEFIDSNNFSGQLTSAGEGDAALERVFPGKTDAIKKAVQQMPMVKQLADLGLMELSPANQQAMQVFGSDGHVASNWTNNANSLTAQHMDRDTLSRDNLTPDKLMKGMSINTAGNSVAEKLINSGGVSDGKISSHGVNQLSFDEIDNIWNTNAEAFSDKNYVASKFEDEVINSGRANQEIEKAFAGTGVFDKQGAEEWLDPSKVTADLTNFKPNEFSTHQKEVERLNATLGPVMGRLQAARAAVAKLSASEGTGLISHAAKSYAQKKLGPQITALESAINQARNGLMTEIDRIP
jgi:hypothetical protein